MIAKVNQIASVVTVEFETAPDEVLTKKIKGIGLVRQSDLVFKGICDDEHKMIDQLNTLGVSVSSPDGGYMGSGAWYGNKSNKRLYGKELVSAIRADLKEAGVKATIRRERCGYSSEITATVTANEEDFITRDEYIKNYEAQKERWFQVPQELGGGEVSSDFVLWENDKYTDAQRRAIVTYHAGKDYDYRMSGDFIDTNKYGKRMSNLVTDSFEKKLRKVQEILNQYNYDESNSMVDYFSVGFYDNVVIKKNLKKIKKSA